MSNNKRDDILNAALELFAERGYDGTTVPMIAEQAKVGAGTIYRYFENKEALVNSLFQDCIHRFSHLLKHRFPADSTDYREKFHHIFRQMVEFAKHNIHGLHFIETHSGARYLDADSNEVFEQFLQFLRDLLDNGKKAGFICELPSNALISIVYGAFVHLYKLIRIGVLEETQELLAGVEERCWQAIKV